MLVTRNKDGFARSTTADFPVPRVAVVEAEQGRTFTNEFLQLFLVTAVVFGVAIVAMSVGTIVANRKLQGSCGGMAGLADEHGKTVCDMCTRPSSECSGDPDAGIASRDG